MGCLEGAGCPWRRRFRDIPHTAQGDDSGRFSGTAGGYELFRFEFWVLPTLLPALIESAVRSILPGFTALAVRNLLPTSGEPGSHSGTTTTCLVWFFPYIDC